MRATFTFVCFVLVLMLGLCITSVGCAPQKPSASSQNKGNSKAGSTTGGSSSAAVKQCEKAAMEHVKKQPETGRILAKGEDLAELPRLEKAYGAGRWCKVVYRKTDDCAQTCALVQYYWEKKSNKVYEPTLLNDFPTPKPCDPAAREKEQKEQQQQQQHGFFNQQRAQQQQAEPEGPDYYKVLGVEKTATKQDIKRAYRKLAMQWHPDKATPETKAEADQKFREISEAYQTLSDDEKRKEYDMWGTNKRGGMGGGGGGFHFSGMDPRDMFKSFFTDEGEGPSFFESFSNGGNVKFTFSTSRGGGGGFGGGGGGAGKRSGGAGGRRSFGSGGFPFGGGMDDDDDDDDGFDTNNIFSSMFGNMFGGGGGGGPAGAGGAKAKARAQQPKFQTRPQGGAKRK